MLTTNGVQFVFDNNIIEGKNFPKPPLFEFEQDRDGVRLVAVNFDGYLIKLLPRKSKLAAGPRHRPKG
jgi:hypothetical protein